MTAHPHPWPPRRAALGLLAAALAATLALVPADPLQAQSTGIDLGEVRHDATAPVEVTADSLALDQAAGRADLEGKVEVRQDTLEIRAERARVFYVMAEGRMTDRVDRIEAEGNVRISIDGQRARADRAGYEVEKGHIRLEGDVVLTRPGLTMSGARLDIDLRAGRGRMSGRVRTVLTGTAGEGN